MNKKVAIIAGSISVFALAAYVGYIKAFRASKSDFDELEKACGSECAVYFMKDYKPEFLKSKIYRLTKTEVAFLHDVIKKTNKNITEPERKKIEELRIKWTKDKK